MKVSLPLALAVLYLPLVAACTTASPPSTAMTYDQQFDFSGVHKIYIEPSSRTDAATIQVSDAQIKRIDGALRAELARKGFQVVTSGDQADLFLNWYLVTKDPVKANASDCPGCDMVVEGGARYSKGTLSVEMIDPIRNQPVWRSILKTELTAEPGSASADKGRAEAAAAIFAQFPPQ